MIGYGTSYCTMAGGNGNFILGTELSFDSEGASIGGGAYNTAGGDFATVKSGYNNINLGDYGTIVNGYENQMSGKGATIIGGSANTATGKYSVVSGGYKNIAEGAYSTIIAGAYNVASGDYSLAAGQYAYAEDYMSATFGFSGNDCISMGDNTINVCTGDEGFQNNGEQVLKLDTSNVNQYSSGGDYLKYTVLLGGVSNSVLEEYGVVGGGVQDAAAGEYSVSVGGLRNRVWSNYGSISGGFQNQVTGRFGSIPGGSRNYARGRFSLAMGYKGDAKHDYSAVFSLTGEDCVSTESEQLKVCADKFKFNGEDIIPKIEIVQSRYLKEINAQDQIFENEKVIAELEKRNAEQDVDIQERQKVIDELTKLVAGLEISL